MGMLDIDDAETVEGQGEALDKVIRFIKNILESVEIEDDEFTFNLYQHGRGSEEEDPVFSSTIEKNGSVTELADEIMEAALEDVAEYYKGTHKYVVRADNVRARCMFSLKVNPKEDEDMDDIEETPSKKGLMSQLMRHQEKVIKMAVGSVKSVMDMQAKAIREKDERITNLESRQFEAIRLTEELVSGKHARDIELRRIEKKEKRTDEITGMVLQGAPMLLQMISGSGKEASPAAQMQPPPGTSRIEMLVEGLIGSLTPEQFSKIGQAGIFEPEQIMALVEVAKEVQAKEQAREVAARVARESANGVAKSQVQEDNKQ